MFVINFTIKPPNKFIIYKLHNPIKVTMSYYCLTTFYFTNCFNFFLNQSYFRNFMSENVKPSLHLLYLFCCDFFDVFYEDGSEFYEYIIKYYTIKVQLPV